MHLPESALTGATSQSSYILILKTCDCNTVSRTVFLLTCLFMDLEEFSLKSSSIFLAMLFTHIIAKVKSNLDKQSVSKLISRNTVFLLASAPDAYWRAVLKRGRGLFQSNRNCLHEI